MESVKAPMQWLLFAAMAAVTVWAFLVPGDKAFLKPDLARIIFFHLPCAFCSLIFIVGGAVQSWRFLSTGDFKFDHRALAANEMGFVLVCLTMATGIIFSKAQWGEWWQNDPRQTSFLMVLLIGGAYLLLRMGFSDPRKRASSSAVYSVAALLPVLFLALVFPRLQQVLQVSSHPSQTIQSGLLKGQYGQVFLAAWVLILIYTIWCYRLRARAGDLALALEAQHARLDDGGHPAATGVVRPVSVSAEHGEEA